MLRSDYPESFEEAAWRPGYQTPKEPESTPLPGMNGTEMEQLENILRERIAILDGSWGVLIQREVRGEEAYRGDRFRDHPRDVAGDPDLLNLTRPEVVERIHRDYFAAGADIATTNTFTATTIGQADYGFDADVVREMNLEGARIARRVADEVGGKLVAGSIGPLNVSLSLSPRVDDPAYRAATFDQVADAYAHQIRSLVEGGVDLLLIETIFDTLNSKAAITAALEVAPEVPRWLSFTAIDRSGRNLSGQTAEAFWVSVEHARPLIAGVNCSLGATEMRPFLEGLARVANTYVSCYPNAGLPNAMGEHDEQPSDTSRYLRAFAEDGLVNVVGGCCGTTPEHIRQIAAAVEAIPPRRVPAHVPATRWSGLEVVGLDERAEPGGAGDVRPLSDHHEPRVGADLERLETAPASPADACRDRPWRHPLDRGRDLADVLGRRAAAPADDVDEAVLGEAAEVAARVARLLVVLPHRVRQARVRVAGHVRVGDARELLEERAHLARAQRAVDSDDERAGVLDGDPERLRGLAREVAAAAVDGGEREPERQLRNDIRRGDDRRLGVQRVEDRLDEQEVDAALGERGDLLRIARPHLLERHRAVRRVIDLRRDRERDVERPDRSGDEAWPVGRPLVPRVGGCTGETGALTAHLRGEVAEVVVALPDRRRRERVRRRDVRAGGEVRVVDLGNELRAREVEQVGITLDVAAVLAQQLAAVLGLGQPPAVDEHAPRAVEHADPAVKDLAELIGCGHGLLAGPPPASRARPVSAPGAL